MAMEATGTIYAIFDTKQVSERFTKREFVLEIADGKYPQTVLFQLTGDRCSHLDGVNIGDEVRVEFNLRGREWTSPKGEVKYFNTLDVWRIEAAKKQPAKPKAAPPPPSAPGPEDDIPFASCDIAHEPSPIARVLRSDS